MDGKIERVYVPMTETGFYILYCLQTPQHGYGIARQVEWMTNGELAIGAGTMYGTLDREIRRIERLYHNSRGEKVDG